MTKSWERADGIVLRLIRHTAFHPKARRLQRTQSSPPSADLIIYGVKRHRDHALDWVVEFENGKGREVVHVRVTSPNPGIGGVEAVAGVLKKRQPRTVAMPPAGLICGLVGNVDRVRQVGLSDAFRIAGKWSWVADGLWLIGTQ